MVVATVIAALLAAVVVALTIAVQDLRDAGRASARSERVISLANRTERNVIDLQAGLRGYVVAGDRAFLAPFDAARAALPDLLTSLRASAPAGQQRARADRIVKDVEDYAGVRAPRLVAVARRDLAAARRRIAAGRGKGVVDTIRGRFDVFVTVEEARATRKRETADDAGRRATVLGIVGAVGSVVLVLLFALYLLLRVVRPVQRLADAVERVSGGDLQVDVPEVGGGEVGRLAREFNAMGRALQEHQDELEGQHVEVEAQRNDLERTYEALSAEKEWTDTLFRFVEQLVAETGAAAVADRTVRGVLELVAADAGALWLLDERGELVREAAVGLDLRDDGPRRPEDGVLGRALAEGRPVRLSHGDTGVEVPGFAGPVRVSHELHLPLHAGDEVVGGLIVARVADRPFSETDAVRARGITEQATVALVRAREVLRTARLGAVNAAMLEATTFGVAMLDDAGEVAFANAAIREMWADMRMPMDGAREEQLARFVELTVDRKLAVARVEQVESDRMRPYEFELHDPETGHWFVAVNTPVRGADGEEIGRIVTIRETTGEREVQRLREEFSATVTHELRTPLSSVVAAVDLLEGEIEEPTAGQRHWSGVIRRNADRLLHLVDDLLTVARAESGEFTLHPSDCDVATIAGDAVASARAAAGGDVEVELVAGPAPIHADANRIAQACDNLLSNAVKFTPAGGRIRVTVQAREDAGAVTLEVADSGVGIPPEDRERLFERFYRTAGATQGAVPGTGLGLTITQAIVAAHGGTIQVRDGLDGGTAFVVELPVGGPAADGAGTPTTQLTAVGPTVDISRLAPSDDKVERGDKHR
ncbi:ATP-binding protein, partial [Patulibacter sp. NPDC049589]|uniref:ATP-binding protein n=1 Tax=Patulibacter sp. NPDC049589 TaxID=3154731 RepID=UPI00343A8D20